MASHYPPTVPQTEAKQDTGPPELLTTLLANYKSFDADEYSDKKRERPFVTLTFAQSNDGKIAGAHGKQLILSGKESMVMTHWLRTMHDGIMVGIGTALNDDPQLNTRHLPPGAAARPPIPIVLDTHLRLRPDCKLISNFRRGLGVQPWIVCADFEENQDRKKQLEDIGVRCLPISRQKEDRISLENVLKTLQSQGINSLMIEGGAQIIQSCLTVDSRHCIDTVIVTTSPDKTVGDEGVGYGSIFSPETELEGFRYAASQEFGSDLVHAWLQTSD